MPINSKTYSFTESNIRSYAEGGKGVYGLYDPTGKAIYYGSSNVSVRDRLLSHHSGNEGSCTKNAYSFNSEWASNPDRREEELLREHRQKYGSNPRCNDTSR